METKSLIIGITGFMLGGLLVSIAAVTFEKPVASLNQNGITMEMMAKSLKSKTGDDYDKAFIAGMIEHHQGAIDMSKQSSRNAKHDEIKKLSADIITAQENEIAQMRQWQRDWGYKMVTDTTHDAH